MDRFKLLLNKFCFTVLCNSSRSDFVTKWSPTSRHLSACFYLIIKCQSCQRKFWFLQVNCLNIFDFSTLTNLNCKCWTNLKHYFVGKLFVYSFHSFQVHALIKKLCDRVWSNYLCSARRTSISNKFYRLYANHIQYNLICQLYAINHLSYECQMENSLVKLTW